MNAQTNKGLAQDLSGAGAWAFALGTSVGWGSLVVTADTYLAQAGPAGSLIGLALGGLVMLVISRNYAYMMACCPEAGGAYAFSREAFGYDHGFLAAWFLALTYFAMLWANATSLPLFARYFIGEVFQVGPLYEIFGYRVYLGEALLSAFCTLAAALWCSRSKRAAAKGMICMAVLFTAGIAICFFGAAARGAAWNPPAFVPDGNALGQIVKIAVISPWAFIGFEAVSHQTEEYSFPHRRIFRVLVVSVATATALYAFITLLSVAAYPAEYDSWLAYIRDLGSLRGTKALPAFYAAESLLGRPGVSVLMASLLSLILTSLVGNITALSRMFYALGKDGILPPKVGELNRHGAPGRAIGLVALVSAAVPFLGRTAIGWIVDVTTLGATLIYAIVSAAAWKTARFRGDGVETKTGLAGVVIMIAFGAYLLLPNLFSKGSMEPESFFLFVVWAMLGFITFHTVLRRDGKDRFGKSIVVWIALLSLVLFVSLVWMNQSILLVTDEAMRAVDTVYTQDGLSQVQSGLIEGQMAAIRLASVRSISVVVLVFAMSLGILLNNYRLMNRQAEHSRRELLAVREMAGRDALTGVKNKLAYTETERDMEAKIASGEAEGFALAVLDVNGLKHINDTSGHHAGDEYIRKACHMICVAFAHSPVFRTGGDEFVVLLRGDDYENRASILERFRADSEAHIALGEAVVSSGCATYRPGEDKALRDLFQRADERMYENKKYLKSKGAVTRL